METPGSIPRRIPGFSAIRTGTAVKSLMSCTSTAWWERSFGEMKKPGRLTQFQFRSARHRVRWHVMMCTLMEQIEIVVALDQRDEARQVAVLAAAKHAGGIAGRGGLADWQQYQMLDRTTSQLEMG